MTFNKLSYYKYRGFIPILITLILIISTFDGLTIFTHAQTVIGTQNVYHEHVGRNGSGCYTKRKEVTETIETPCPGQMVYFADADKSQCSFCGASYFGDQSGRECYYSTTREEKHTYYDLGCGLSTGSVMGKFEVSKSTEEWVKELYLTMSVEPLSVTSDSNSPFNINNENVAGYEYKVTACGDYSVSLKTAYGYSAPALNVPVRNIDTTGPTLVNYSYSPTAWTANSITITLDSVEDLQPDKSQGCGLSDTPYSYDNGTNWVSNNSFTVDSNGNNTVLLKDKLDNISTYTINIQNIDKEAPRITDVDYDKTEYVKNVTLVVTADDIMSDGREGVGLHETPYSFDDGETWSDDNTLFVEECCSIDIAVRDKLENISRLTVEINNIDCYGPEITHTPHPSGPTTGSVRVNICVKDVGYNGSRGIGLPEEYLSFDNGSTWTDKNYFSTDVNKKVSVLARDKNDNISSYTIKIDNIYTESDEEPPEEDDPPKVIPTPSPTPNPPPSTPPKKIRKRKPTVTPPSDDTPTENITPSPTTKQVKIDSREKQDAPKEIVISNFDNNGDDGFSWIDMLLIILAALLALLLLFLLLFLLSRMVRIYNIIGKNDFSFKGICLIHCKDGIYEINIDKSIIDACGTNKLELRFSKLFILMHRDDDVTVYLPDKQSYIVKPSDASLLVIKH